MTEIIKKYNSGQSVLTISKDSNLPYRRVWKKLNDANLIRTKKKIKDTEFNCNYFESIDSQDKAYFLGLIHADGCVHITKENKLRFVIALKEEDGYLIHKLAEVLELPRSKVGIVPASQTGGQQTRLQIANQSFISHIKDVKNSKIMDKIPPHLIPHFIRGVFDGDGTIYTKYSKRIHKYYYMGFIGNLDFLYFLQQHSPVKFKLRPTNSLGMYRSEIYSKDDVLKFGEFLYKDSIIHMNRKFNKFMDAKFQYCTSTTTWKTPELEREGDDIV